jgi:hypothetical protein
MMVKKDSLREIIFGRVLFFLQLHTKQRRTVVLLSG